MLAKATPPIDSIGYTNKPGQLQLYVNAHDNSNQTIYYQYGFSEAWYFHARFLSGYIFNGSHITLRTPAQDVYNCYGQDTSTSVIINSTAALSKDLVYQFPISSMSDTSERLELRYSILVSQRALTKEGYNFWQNLKTNTEQLGSIFDAQPSSIAGNIHNAADASEPVIGFISAGTIQKKRIYVNKADLPANYVPGYPYGCGPAQASDEPIPPFPYLESKILKVTNSPLRIIAKGSFDGFDTYDFTSTACGDCTIRGTHNPPAFWKP